MLRLLHKAQRIRTRKLRAAPNDDNPSRPKGMHRATYQRLVSEANAADTQSWGEVARFLRLL